MILPEELKAAFSKCAVDALATFPKTAGQCVALCAYISARLTEDSIANRVALGSLSCNGVKTFQYKKPISVAPSGSSVWDGHAWIEFPDGVIGEPSLFRTAKAFPKHSSLRQNLEAHGLIDRGAILISASDALKDYGLKYRQRTYLKEAAFVPLIHGLMAINELINHE
ncbi:hypothetical protein A1351_18715 [Methylosinus sp. R-45379]|nr:hypothetical protein A1351_18715 [Methylosinus sp. R-45379]